MGFPKLTTGARSGQSFDCPDCGTPMPLKVLQSNAGHYLGHWCDSDPNAECNWSQWSRETRYYPTREAAQQALDDDSFISSR